MSAVLAIVFTVSATLKMSMMMMMMMMMMVMVPGTAGRMDTWNDVSGMQTIVVKQLSAKS